MAKIQDCPGFEPFGADVKAARKQMRLSRQKVAELLNISQFWPIVPTAARSCTTTAVSR